MEDRGSRVLIQQKIGKYLLGPILHNGKSHHIRLAQVCDESIPVENRSVSIKLIKKTQMKDYQK